MTFPVLVVVCIAACDPHCWRCTSAGPDKCDSNQCNARYAYASESQTCIGNQPNCFHRFYASLSLAILHFSVHKDISNLYVSQFTVTTVIFLLRAEMPTLLLLDLFLGCCVVSSSFCISLIYLFHHKIIAI